MSDELMDGEAFLESLHEGMDRMSRTTGVRPGGMVLRLGSRAVVDIAAWGRRHRAMLLAGEARDLEVVAAIVPIAVETDPTIDASQFFGPDHVKIGIRQDAGVDDFDAPLPHVVLGD